MRTTIRNVVVLAVAALVVTATAVSVQGAGGGDKYKCRVKNMTTREASDDLQAQIDAAWTGDTLKIKGLCVGNFTIPNGADLTLLGVEKAGASATLDGDGSGTVLFIDGDPDLTFVTLTDLTIRGGVTYPDGGGIFNRGSLTLSGSTQVIWNEAWMWGGGIYNEGSLVLSGSTKVRHNWAFDRGGGILNLGGKVTLKEEAEVSWNDGTVSGGGISNVTGTLDVLDDAQVSWNYAFEGGGIQSSGPDARVTIRVRSKVEGNTARDGGGIHNGGESNLQLDQDALVVGNKADSRGGGIFNNQIPTTAMMWPHSSVTGNIADADNDGYGEGGGIYGCVMYAVDGGNVDDNHLVSMSGPEDNIANGCP